jgi:hypothetical protein
MQNHNFWYFYDKLTQELIIQMTEGKDFLDCDGMIKLNINDIIEK